MNLQAKIQELSAARAALNEQAANVCDTNESQAKALLVIAPTSAT